MRFLHVRFPMLQVIFIVSNWIQNFPFFMLQYNLIEDNHSFFAWELFLVVMYLYAFQINHKPSTSHMGATKWNHFGQRPTAYKCLNGVNFSCILLTSNIMVSGSIWKNIHWWVFERRDIALMQFWLSLKNSLVHVFFLNSTGNHTITYIN